MARMLQDEYEKNNVAFRLGEKVTALHGDQAKGVEADGVGLYGDDTVTTKEVLKFEEVE